MESKVLDISREQMLAEVAEQLKPFEPPDEWFTAREFAEASGFTDKKAQYHLNKLVDEGKVNKHKKGYSVYFEMVKDD